MDTDLFGTKKGTACAPAQPFPAMLYCLPGSPGYSTVSTAAREAASSPFASVTIHRYSKPFRFAVPRTSNSAER